MAVLSRLATALFLVAIPVLLVSSNIRFFAGEVRLYERGFRKYDAAQTTQVSLPELDRAAGEIIDYFENDSETLRILVTRQGEEVSLFNARETVHMKDVKWLMQIVFRVQEISFAYVITYIAMVYLWSRERPLRDLAKQALMGLGVGAAVVIGIGVPAVIDFHATWDRFHMLVFRNNFWQLDPERDRLIQMFPQPFWQESAYIVTAMTVAEAAVIVILSVAFLVFSREPTSEEQPQRSAARPGDLPTPPPPAGATGT